MTFLAAAKQFDLRKPLQEIFFFIKFERMRDQMKSYFNREIKSPIYIFFIISEKFAHIYKSRNSTGK